MQTSDLVSLTEEYAAVVSRLDALEAITAEYNARRRVLEDLLDARRLPDVLTRPYDLLTAAEEVELAHLVAASLEAVAAGAAPTDETVRLGRLARERFVLGNVRLVISVLRSMATGGMDFDDRMQAGLIGVLRAAEEFDPSFGTKFSTYATWWIRQSVQRTVADQSRVVRLPVHVHEDVVPVRAAQRALAESLGREPSIDELSAATGRAAAKVEHVLTIDRTVIDLDAARRELDGDVDRWATRSDLAVEDARDRTLQCRRVLALLTERESDVLRRRCGYDTGREETLEEIGQSYGVTRERIRQIEPKVKKKILETMDGEAI